MQTLVKPNTAVVRAFSARQQPRHQGATQPTVVAQPLLKAAPTLDRHTYEALIVQATAHYAAGCRRIHIDLQQTQRIEQSGLYALYCVHLIFQGEPLPPQEMGIGALRYVTERVQLDGTQPVFVINAPDHLVPLLQRTGFAIVNAIRPTSTPKRLIESSGSLIENGAD